MSYLVAGFSLAVDLISIEILLTIYVNTLLYELLWVRPKALQYIIVPYVKNDNVKYRMLVD